MVGSINDLTSAVNALVTANNTWFSSLEEKAENNEAESKVTTLRFFDEILRSSIQSIQPTNTNYLGRLVSEIRGYQGLTERFFSELRELAVKDHLLENDAVKKRDGLFQVLDQVQQWLLADAGVISPSDFDAGTNQFLALIQADPKEVTLTQQLFKDQQLELIESELRSVTDAWGNVVSSFVEDAQNTTDTDDSLNIGDPMTIASFFCIQNRLETLYGRLDTNVSLVN